MTIFNIDKTLIEDEQLPHEDEASRISLKRRGLWDTYDKLLTNDSIGIDDIPMDEVIELVRLDIILLSKRTIYVGSPIIKVSILLHQHDYPEGM